MLDQVWISFEILSKYLFLECTYRYRKFQIMTVKICKCPKNEHTRFLFDAKYQIQGCFLLLSFESVNSLLFTKCVAWLPPEQDTCGQRICEKRQKIGEREIRGISRALCKESMKAVAR